MLRTISVKCLNNAHFVVMAYARMSDGMADAGIEILPDIVVPLAPSKQAFRQISPAWTPGFGAKQSPVGSANVAGTLDRQFTRLADPGPVG
jgi:hypothetical protein